MRARQRDFAAAALLVGAPVAAGGLAFPEAVLAVIFGPAYDGAAPALVLLMAAALLAYLGTAAATALVAWHDQTAHMVAFGIGAVGNVALNLVLIPRYGIVGAALATVAAQGLVTASVLARLKLRFGALGLGGALAFALAAGLAFGGFRLAETLLGARLLADAPALRLVAGGAICGLVYLALAAALRPRDLRRAADSLLRALRRSPTPTA